MALFGRKAESENKPVDYEAEKEKKERESLCELLNSRANKVKNIVGSKGQGEYPFAEHQDYVFYMDDDEYIFEPIYSSYYAMDIEELRKAVKLDEIRLLKSHCICELENTAIVEQKKAQVGELVVKISPIKVAFVNRETGDKMIFCFQNKPQNISNNTSFFMNLGVKNFYNIVNLPRDVMEVCVLNGNKFLPDKTSYVIFRSDNKL